VERRKLCSASTRRCSDMGRVDLPALLAAPLPEAADLTSVAAFGTQEDDAVARIAAMISSDPVRVRTRLAELLKVSSHQELNETIAAHEGELVYLALADRKFAKTLARPDSLGALSAKINTAGVSGELSARLAG
jgi:hypothetical protein